MGEEEREKYFSRRLPTPAPLGSLDTLFRLPSPLNQDGGSSIEAYKSRKSHGKIGDCNSLLHYFHVAKSSEPNRKVYGLPFYREVRHPLEEIRLNSEEVFFELKLQRGS